MPSDRKLPSDTKPDGKYKQSINSPSMPSDRRLRSSDTNNRSNTTPNNNNYAIWLGIICLIIFSLFIGTFIGLEITLLEYNCTSIN